MVELIHPNAALHRINLTDGAGLEQGMDLLQGRAKAKGVAGHVTNASLQHCHGELRAFSFIQTDGLFGQEMFMRGDGSQGGFIEAIGRGGQHDGIDRHASQQLFHGGKWNN